jgi:ParB family chromosome partitioning protein
MSPALLAQIAAGASLKTEKIESHVDDINVVDIIPNPHQPRMDYDPTELGALAESIRLHGLIQPIAVVRNDHGFTLVAGHSRLEAHKILGRDTIRANIIEADDDDLAMLALIENVNRADLHPLEIAIALSREPFLSMRDDHIAAALGYSTTKVRNIRATLRLSQRVRDDLGQPWRNGIGLDVLAELQKITDEEEQFSLYDSYCNRLVDREAIRAAVRAQNRSGETKEIKPISRVGSGYKIDCSAIMDHQRESFENELAILLDKYSKSAGGSEA